ncbi:hypothetical protein C8Q72DRAFT_344799 [Fomitopsis betulina]|nr:hypothetical protein C8Q72DRAFT_344799 [Fomitopsis betulina]
MQAPEPWEPWRGRVPVAPLRSRACPPPACRPAAARSIVWRVGYWCRLHSGLYGTNADPWCLRLHSARSGCASPAGGAPRRSRRVLVKGGPSRYVPVCWPYCCKLTCLIADGWRRRLEHPTSHLPTSPRATLMPGHLRIHVPNFSATPALSYPHPLFSFTLVYGARHAFVPLPCRVLLVPPRHAPVLPSHRTPVPSSCFPLPGWPPSCPSAAAPARGFASVPTIVYPPSRTCPTTPIAPVCHRPGARLPACARAFVWTPTTAFVPGPSA